jgi:uncharacterized protein Yka (UPF0111/DUF47 family)
MVSCPREERFFDLFAKHSDVVAAGAKALRDMLEGGDSVDRNCKTVMDREQDADNITREVLIAVRRSFITPFDRGDIKDLIHGRRHRPDAADRQDHQLFQQRSFTPQQREMADAIVLCADLVREAMPLLSSINTNAGRISEISEQISQIEGRADELHDIGLRELYRAHQPSNSMAFFIGVEIYDHLETVVDRFDDVGNEISGIVIENV